jgi:hypothetical protein
MTFILIQSGWNSLSCLAFDVGSMFWEQMHFFCLVV